MKKAVAILLALIFALSAFSVMAFAADDPAAAAPDLAGTLTTLLPKLLELAQKIPYQQILAKMIELAKQIIPLFSGLLAAAK